MRNTDDHHDKMISDSKVEMFCARSKNASASIGTRKC